MNQTQVLSVLIVLGIVFSSLCTYYLFPQIVLKEPEIQVITIAIGHGYHYSAPIIMQYLKLVEKYSNGTVKLNIEVLNAGIMTDALIAGSIQFAQRSGPAVLTTIDSGAPFKALISIGKQEHELWTRNLNIHSISDLTADTKINLVAPTSIESIGLTIKLAELGKTIDDVTPIYITHADAYQAMISGEIDCHYVGAPYSSRYASEPDKYRLLAKDSTIFGMELPASLLYGTIDWVNENPSITAYVVSAWLEAIGWMNTNIEEAVKVIAQFYGDPVDAAYDEWIASGTVFDPTTGLSSLAKLSEMLYDNGLLNRKYSIDEILFPIGLGER